MTTKEKIKAIREQFKLLGYNNRKISVTDGGGTLESSIRVRVKFVPILEQIQEIKEVAEKFRQVLYDEATGEILAGGNTFVNVSYPSNEDERKRYFV
ncbi:hypothetical protein [Capnocytophaga sp. oral taxon 878]|uniref:hypothetical protein n=1 Tax=Capnocytophaga sp. oral taxon 878 TaxID=1316596 RepID=UPI000D0264D2|nr:hypothetical protein [Capnocytophaga sp. oral taxon 878]AVM51534.1 hypothetical protein C4H12_13530 [Capnocytophaga sp. oral taxon 878]